MHVTQLCVIWMDGWGWQFRFTWICNPPSAGSQQSYVLHYLVSEFHVYIVPSVEITLFPHWDIKRLLEFYDPRFAREPRFYYYLFSQKMRHGACRAIAKLRGGEHLTKIQQLLDDPDFDKTLKWACESEANMTQYFFYWPQMKDSPRNVKIYHVTFQMNIVTLMRPNIVDLMRTKIVTLMGTNIVTFIWTLFYASCLKCGLAVWWCPFWGYEPVNEILCHMNSARGRKLRNQLVPLMTMTGKRLSWSPGERAASLAHITHFDCSCVSANILKNTLIQQIQFMMFI